jgi:riboflavin synthase
MVEKGSVTVDGVSLTITAVSAVDEEPVWFEVALIPHTLQVTVLGSRDVGSRVNIEVDVLAKYVERVLEARR